jgi:hypothetical protein
MAALLLAVVVVAAWACGDPPWVWIVAPTNYATVSGVAPIQIEVKSGIQVTGIDVYLDDQLAITLASAPYKCQWPTTKSAEGWHQLRAVAHRQDGADGTSKRVYVVVENKT